MAGKQAPVPPQNLDAEESVLGAILLTEISVDYAPAIELVSEILAADGHEFYRESHGTIYRAVLRVHGRGGPVDAITVSDELEKTDELEAVGGRARIHELAAIVPAAANAKHYAAIVREMAALRDLIKVGGEISRLGWDRPDETAALVEKAEGLVFALSQGRDTGDFRRASDAIREAYTALVERSAHGRSVIGTATGFGHLDALTAGFQPGNLIVLAARPSIGKTALALCVLANASIRAGAPVALFTLEMSESEVMQRLLSMEAHVESTKVRTGRGLGAEEWGRLTDAAAKIEAAPLFTHDGALLTVADVRAKARRMKAKHPALALVAVDYLQLMTGEGNEENRAQEVGRISRALKILAREIDTPVLALSQLNRQVEQRHDKRPLLSDLRESGAVEQDADLVLMLYRDEYYHPESAAEDGTEGVAEVNIAKQRNGPTGTVKLAWVKKYASFSNLAPGQ